MNREKLLKIRDEINNLIKKFENHDLIYITKMEDEMGKYDLYLFPKNTKENLDWYDAIKYCNDLGGNLPSSKELDYLYNNCYDRIGPGFYWSSTEVSDTTAIHKSFISGCNSLAFKNVYYGVRAIRRLRI